MAAGEEKADPATGINEQAPIRSEGEIEIAAPPAVVWHVLSGLERWPEWNPDVKSVSMRGPLSPGSVFRWKAGPGTITSTLLHVEPPRLIAWRGSTLGIKAIHFWWLQPTDGGTLVSTAESYEGLVARLLHGPIQRALDDGLESGLRHLKAESERRATATEQA